MLVRIIDEHDDQTLGYIQGNFRKEDFEDVMKKVIQEEQGDRQTDQIINELKNQGWNAHWKRVHEVYF